MTRQGKDVIHLQNPVLMKRWRVNRSGASTLAWGLFMLDKLRVTQNYANVRLAGPQKSQQWWCRGQDRGNREAVAPMRGPAEYASSASHAADVHLRPVEYIAERLT